MGDLVKIAVKMGESVNVGFMGRAGKWVCTILNNLDDKDD